ncbi:PDR/VanB family oxidoreductase [Dactylosporangium sp. CA-092794]|uniref:PDR/VanB family oxidoreductase n=1 Tax=Dactylosporangium sp. CA-092794 TaxID=3239929 RepID=UPI003D91CD2C
MAGDEADGVLDLMVEQLRVESDGVLSVVLVDPAGGLLPVWAPGAHIDLGVPHGDPGMIVRQYSLCGDPADRFRYTVAVLREPASRGGSGYVHEVLRPGDLVEVGGPRNHFTLAPAGRYRFIAGGIGITPILPMLAEAEARGVPWTLTYGGRRRASMAFLDRLTAYGDRISVVPQDERGHPDLAALLGTPEPGTAVYCCGPAGLLDAVQAACGAWPAGAVHLERFMPKSVDTGPDRAFDVVCARSGGQFTVAPGQSILDRLETLGVDVPNACRTGVCGSCETKILDGAPEHRDSVLAPDADATLMVCVSRSATDRLVLDL